MSAAILSITLYPQQNKVHFAASEDKGGQSAGAGHAVYQFKRNWACQVLYLLWLEGQVGHSLTDTVLQQSLRQKGQTQNLNRMQLQRLFTELNKFLSQLPGQPLRLHTAPRQATVGPWALVCTAPVRFHDAEATPVMQTGPALWPYPLLLRPKNVGQGMSSITCIDTLCQFLSLLLTADAFAVNGDYAAAIDSLQHVYPLPLTDEIICVIWLREALWKNRLGQFDAARSLVKRVLANPPSLDPAQVKNARFLLNRIDYDEGAPNAYATLWHSMTPLDVAQGADSRILPEWHNLRALVTRRRLLSLHLPKVQGQPICTQVGQAVSENPVALHASAMNHFQSAIYWGLQKRDWDRLLAYAANAALQLDVVLPLGLTTIRQILNWHRLCLAYGDKLYLAQDSGCEFILLGEFWLKYNKKFKRDELDDLLLHTADNFHPSRQDFYIKGIEKLKKCADVKQIIVMWILYYYFVENFMGVEFNNSLVEKGKSKEVIRNSIGSLLGEHPGLLEMIKDETCIIWLPDGL